ncbi:MAG: hypothetical protein HC839_04230 [Leptolyngbyaceae cyanobacterium RM2_2_21]|nr:hypothetical protein [Leptolyngbyaceae cyanobacterium RM2_2_21]
MPPSQIMGLLVGGLAPALLFGLFGVLQKLSNQSNIGLGPYLIGIGVGVFIIGGVSYGLLPNRSLPPIAFGYAVLMGLFWASGAALVAVGLTYYGTPISKLVPLYNMNTLIAVLLGLLLFAEWQDISVVKLLLGAVLIGGGGVLVASA